MDICIHGGRGGVDLQGVRGVDLYTGLEGCRFAYRAGGAMVSVDLYTGREKAV